MKHFRALQTTFSDPESIDDCSEVYGDDFPEVTEPCEKSPTRQCVYSGLDNWTRCIHCRCESGL